MPLRQTNHLAAAIVTSPFRGSGGSLFAWETYSACERSGLPAILATLDPLHIYPEIGNELRRIEVPGKDAFFGAENLDHIIAEARDLQKFLIIDLPRDFGDDISIKQVLRHSLIAENSTIAGLIPLMPGQPGTWAAAMGIGAFENTGIQFNHGLFRFWDSERGLCPPDFPHLLGFPFWVAPTLSSRALSLIQAETRRSPYPPADWLPGLRLVEPSRRDATPDSWVIREIEQHLEDATRQIYQAILAPYFRSDEAA